MLQSLLIFFNSVTMILKLDLLYNLLGEKIDSMIVVGQQTGRKERELSMNPLDSTEKCSLYPQEQKRIYISQ